MLFNDGKFRISAEITGEESGSRLGKCGHSCPTVEQVALRSVGIDVTVSIDSSGAGKVAEFTPGIENKPHPGKPKILFMGVEPEQLGTRDIVNQRSTEFWTVSDYVKARSEFGSQIDKYLPQMTRISLEKYVWTLRLRGRPGNLLRELVHPESSRHPLKGNELHPSHTRDAATVLVVSPAKAAEVAEHFRTELLVEGAYPFSPQRIAMLRRLVGLCEKQGVSLVFFEQPNAAVFDGCLPDDTRTRFLEEFRAMTNGSDNTKFYSLDDLCLKYENSDFRDPVHLNLTGARRLSESVCRTCRRPILSPTSIPY